MESVDFLLAPALLAQNSVSAPMAGTNIGGARFDTVITEQLPSEHRRFTVYARYWVTPTAYQVQIIWAEPSGFDSGFPFYGPGILISSTPIEFVVTQGALGSTEQHFQKPLGPRPILRYMFGDYPPANMRFGEAEAMRNMTAESPPLTRTAGEGSPSTKVIIEEGKIQVGFRGAGIKVCVNGITNQFRDLSLARDKGGRIVVADYGKVNVGDQSFNSPLSVEIRNSRSGAFLRSASIAGYKTFGPAVDQAFIFSDGLICFPPEYREYLLLVKKYGSKSFGQIPPGEKESASRALNYLWREAEGQKDATAESLQYLGIVLELARLLDDTDLMEKAFPKYLRSLGAIGPKELIVTSGYSVIDRLAVSGKPTEASNLLRLWLRAVRESSDLESIRSFVGLNMPVKSVWAAAKLSEDVLEFADLTRDTRYELEAARYIALRGSEALCKNAQSSTNSRVKAYATWISYSLGTNSLNDLVCCSGKTMEQEFKKLTAPSEAQVRLAKEAGLLSSSAK